MARRHVAAGEWRNRALAAEQEVLRLRAIVAATHQRVVVAQIAHAGGRQFDVSVLLGAASQLLAAGLAEN